MRVAKVGLYKFEELLPHIQEGVLEIWISTYGRNYEAEEAREIMEARLRLHNYEFTWIGELWDRQGDEVQE